jgi:MFS family permease
VTVTAGLALVIFGLGEAQSTSWTSKPTLIGLILAPVFILAFVVIEHHTAEPLLPFALLRRRAAVGNLLSVLQQSVGASTAFLAPLLMQQVWGFSAGRAGAATLPLPIGFGIGARVSSRLVPRVGEKRLVVVGFTIVVCGCFLLSRVPTHGDYFTTFMPALFLRSFGQGLVVVPVVLIVTSGVEKKDQGIAAGLFNMSQQLGGAIGLAVIATIAAAATSPGPNHLAGEAHGIRVAFLVALGIAVVGATLALTAMKGTPRGVEREITVLGPEGEPVPADDRRPS